MASPTDVRLLDTETLLSLDLNGVKLIEASAGTGKTHTIADLYLRHILAGRRTSEILIVTYTNAATEELRGRIHGRLYEAASALVDENDSKDPFLAGLQQQWREQDAEEQTLQQRRLQLALRSLDEAAISTIHSFCHKSLQERALAGNQLFESELLMDDGDLWRRAARDWWRQQSDRLDSGSWELLCNQLGHLEKLTRILLELRNKPAALMLPETDTDLETLLRQPHDLCSNLHALAPIWQQHREELEDILKTSKALSRAKALPYHPQQIEAWLDAADAFFCANTVSGVFDNFHFLGSESLHQNSKKTQLGKDPRLEHDFFRAVDPIAKAWCEFREQLGPGLKLDALQQTSSWVFEQKQQQAALAFQDQLDLLLKALESETGETLAAGLRQQYPVAMIDEFQDTDAIQYRIFDCIYNRGQDVSLTLIGDPKQAIYSFRGGDIFTYMQARRLPSVDHYSLGRNWRSAPELVTAVNSLFESRPNPFVYEGSIDFHPASANPENHRYALSSSSLDSAMVLWQLPQDDEGNPFSRSQMREMINRAVVNEISRLLGDGQADPAQIEGQAVESGDIAILVRTAAEGQALSQQLHQQGIRTVTIGRDSVFASDEARGLYDLLLAISKYQDATLANRSLASNLLYFDYLEISAQFDDDSRWQSWLDLLAELHLLWQRFGFIAMFQAMLQKLEIHRRLAEREGGERRLTNLLHLGELLHQQSRRQAGMTALLAWLVEQFDADSQEESELRLEDDSALVKIVTIHKSKGLQYPIVFVPFLWRCRTVDRKQPVAFHDSNFNACIDLGSGEIETHYRVAEKERLAEDLRLLYVAVTRARSRVYLAWGRAGSASHAGHAGQTALAYLLHSGQPAEELASTSINAFTDEIDFEADLQRLVDRANGAIARVPLPSDDNLSRASIAASATEAPRLANYTRAAEIPWRVNSFTALTRGVHQPALLSTAATSDDAILEFPAGSHIGLMLHSILENLDFEGDIAAQCENLFQRFLAPAGIGSEYESTLLAWLHNILLTPLDGEKLALCRINNRRRLNELAFDFSLDRVDTDALNHFMQSCSASPLQPIGSHHFRGMITGIIDLVFEYGGRYYLADYKSNYLGSKLEDYNREQLQTAMLDRRYDLQSMLYALALHRMLQVRLPDYDYDRHFGGSYYLFLRAMRPAESNRQGIHFERPTRDQMLSFDALFAGTSQPGQRA